MARKRVPIAVIFPRALDRLSPKSGKPSSPSFPLILKLLSGNLFAMKASTHRRVHRTSQEAQ
jgi:hypothetical protein